MAKIYGLQGAMTGKLANTVMVVRNGEQLARKYQPVVYNPSTEGQVAARAKLKLMSQLSAVMAPVIAIPRQGTISSRNMFTKKNYPAVTSADGTANIELSDIKLTDSVVSLPALSIEAASNSVSIRLSSATPGLSRVVYVMFIKQDDNTLRLVDSKAVGIPGSSQDYQTGFTTVTGSNYVFYAYGVRDNTEAARTKFGELTVVTAETVAKIVATRQLTGADVTLTETRYGTITA